MTPAAALSDYKICERRIWVRRIVADGGAGLFIMVEQLDLAIASLTLPEWAMHHPPYQSCRLPKPLICLHGSAPTRDGAPSLPP
ncbi:unnamed protein product [Soboliphyme baturini]|uniref:Transposase n=1 Tax=Soboliphyme baturini TaxID=241478 RepID=A0A183J9L3_9BILA|nr:unnamed protein product [Soboliphyme baturini]